MASGDAMRGGLVLAALLVLAGGCKDQGDDDSADPPEPDELSLSLTSPDDGAVGTWSAVAAEGAVTGEDPQVTVNGEEARLTGDTFVVDLSISGDDPAIPLLAEATDPSGWVRDRRTLLVGDPVDTASVVDQGMAIRLTDQGLDGLEGMVASSFDPATIEQLIMDSNPLYEGDLVVATVTITADDVSVGGMELDLDATSAGLALTGVLSDVWLDVTIDGGWAGEWPGTIWVDAVNMTGLIVLGVSAGSLTVEVQQVAVDLEGVVLDFEDLPSWLDTALSWVVPLMFEGVIEDMLAQEIPPALQDALGALDQGFALGPVTIGLAFDGVSHDDDGINVILDLEVDTGGAAGLPAARASTPGALPTMEGSLTPSSQPYGAMVVLDDDALNAIGIGLLASGTLDQEMDGALPTDPPLPLTAAMFTGIFPSLEGELSDTDLMSMRTEASVPLVGRPAEGPDGVLDLYLPGFWVTIGGDLSGSGSASDIYDVVVDGVIRVAVDAEQGALAVYGDDMTATLIRCEIECAPDEGEGLAALLEMAIGMFVGDLTSGLTQLIDGVEMVPLEGGICGPAGDHAALYADLVSTSAR